MPVPEGYHSVTPFVIVKDAARFLDFMADAFDAQEIVESWSRMAGIGQRREPDRRLRGHGF